MKKILIFTAIIAAVLIAAALIKPTGMEQRPQSVSSFAECASAGYPVMESYPRQCRDAAGNSFTEDIGNALEKADLIRVTSITPNERIESPMLIAGEARGNWFFEASFPIVLEDANGNSVPLDPPYITANGEWMTTEFVEFMESVTFAAPDTDTGTLILRKDNASGLPEHDDELIIPVRFR